MSLEKEIRRCNDAFREVGITPHNEPLYKWIFAPEMQHYRYQLGKDNWKSHACGLRPSMLIGEAAEQVIIWIPEPTFERVKSFPHLGPRWLIAKWDGISLYDWEKHFGSHAVYPPQGYYFPTDRIMRPGKYPSMDLTEYFIRCIRYSRTKTIADWDAEAEAILAKEERDSFNRTYDQIQDACTAFGNKPGSRSGGVSFPA